MRTTKPITNAAVNQISNRLTTVYPQYASEAIGGSTMPSAAILVVFPGAGAMLGATWGKGRYAARNDIGAIQLAAKEAEPFQVILESQTPVPPDDSDTTRPLEVSHLMEFISEQRSVDEESDWEEYGEPLWDPIATEVALLVKDYFERADADLERTE